MAAFAWHDAKRLADYFASKLRQAKRSSRESFSDGVRRANWDEPAELLLVRKKTTGKLTAVAPLHP